MLRTTLLAGLVALLVAGLRDADEGPRITRLTGAPSDVDRLASVLVDPVAPLAVVRDAGDEPSEHELQALAGVAERAPLFVELPRESARLRVVPPDAPLVDRYAAVRFVATATPGDTLTARLVGPDRTALDSTRVVADPAGSAAGAFRVRQGREGWTEWRVAVAGPGLAASPGNRASATDERVASAGAWVAHAGAWVADAGPPRVLVVAGPPSWETRYAVRALERSGAELSLVQELGRGNVITGGAVEEWGTERALAAYDVVILLPGSDPAPVVLAALDPWVAAGRGLLAASTAAGGERIVRGDSLVWTAPAEIAALPAADLRARVIPSTVPSGASVSPGAVVAARTAAGDPLLVLAPFGRGRVAGLGLRESWRWAMDAGLEIEHRAFWRSMVDWLATPAADSLAVRVEPAEGAAGITVDVGFRRGPLDIERPRGEAEPIPATRDAERVRGRFVAVDTGMHMVRTRSDGGGSTVAAFRSRSSSDADAAELGRARLALLAAASGGAALEAEAFDARVEGLGGAGDRPGRWLPLLFAALALLGIGEWGLRRWRGLP